MEGFLLQILRRQGKKALSFLFSNNNYVGNPLLSFLTLNKSLSCTLPSHDLTQVRKLFQVSRCQSTLWVEKRGSGRCHSTLWVEKMEWEMPSHHHLSQSILQSTNIVIDLPCHSTLWIEKRGSGRCHPITVYRNPYCNPLILWSISATVHHILSSPPSPTISTITHHHPPYPICSITTSSSLQIISTTSVFRCWGSPLNTMHPQPSPNFMKW